MIKEAIDKIISLASLEVIEVDSRQFTSRSVNEIRPQLIEPIVVHSLTAIVDFFEGEVDVNCDVNPDLTVIHIVDPHTVKVIDGVADDTYRNREHFLTAQRINSEFEFDTYFDQEKMVMKLLTMFEQTTVLEDVIKVVSGLIVSSDIEVNDDGISQEVKVRKGASRIEKVEIKNPIMLKPIRTFTEVDQVESPYVLRIRERNGEPQIAIFEAGGGQWKNDAIQNIKKWLAKRIKGVKILG